METTEIKLKLENDINSLKREQKSLVAQVSTLKSEYTTLNDMNEKQKKLKEEQDSYLKDVLNDISNAKIQWMHEKEAEIVEITKKKQEIDSILSRKSELDIQEKKITDIFDANTKILNEKKVLELELKRTITDIEAQKKALEIQKLEILNIEKSIENKKQELKDKLNKVISEIKL